VREKKRERKAEKQTERNTAREKVISQQQPEQEIPFISKQILMIFIGNLI
jgi:hypothetical protein